LGGWHVLERGLKVLDELGSEPRVSNAIGGSRDLNHHDDDQPLLRIDKKRRAGRTCSNEMTELIRASTYGDAKSFLLFQPANHPRVRRRYKVSDLTDFTDAGPAGRWCSPGFG